jgi:hypothetical protein
MRTADVDITVARQWGFADTGRERLSGEREPFPADFDEDIEPGWEIFALSFRRSEGTFRGLPPVLVGRTVHFLHKPKKRRGVFVREGGCVRLAFVDLPGELLGSPVRVLHLRKWLLLLPLLLAATLLCLTLTLCGSGSSSPDFLSGMTGTAGAVQKPVISVDYASFDATVDSVWVADSMTQDFTLSLPATCQYAKGKEGGNPIISSPSVMVDFNHDSKYSDNECVYNPAGKDGFGAFLRPGCEVNRIRLTQPVKAGTYSARTVWNSVLERDGKTPAGSTSFDFTLAVE